MCVLSVDAGGVGVAVVYDDVGIDYYDVDYDDAVVYPGCVVDVDNAVDVVTGYDIGVIDTSVVVVVGAAHVVIFQCI